MYEEVKHPCIQHKLALIRDVGSGHKIFRELATEITMFVCYYFLFVTTFDLLLCFVCYYFLFVTTVSLISFFKP